MSRAQVAFRAPYLVSTEIIMPVRTPSSTVLRPEIVPVPVLGRFRIPRGPTLGK